MVSTKKRLNFWQILSMSMGFLGIQMGFAIQNANASRILQTYGAGVEHLSWFWIVAPLTGMIIQPIIGFYSDKTWCKLGRRRPYFLVGSIITALALILLPNAGVFAGLFPAVLIGAGFLMIMDAGINVTMEPFRALVADMLPSEQATIGFSVQTFLIGIGAVLGSWLPYILSQCFGLENATTSAGVPLNLLYSFYVGAVVLVLTILWTVFSTKEYSPEQLAEFDNNGNQLRTVKEKSNFSSLVQDILNMPKVMLQLGLVQFFSWIALFSMWVYMTPIVAERVFGICSPADSKYQIAGDWVGVLFGVYNFVAMLFALVLIPLSNKFGKKYTHAVALLIGGLSLLSIYFIHSEYILVLPMVGVGIAWASILAMPYAILAPALPTQKTGVYMGIFNFFITIPQIINSVFSGLVLKYIFAMDVVWMIVMSGAFLIIGALSVLFVRERR